MASYRFTMGFRQSGRVATETYYHDASTLVDAGILAQNLVDGRNAMLFNTTEWVGVRIGLADVTRNAQLFTPGDYNIASDNILLTVPGKGKLLPQKGYSGVDQPNSCIQMVLRFGDTRSTKRYLSFVPDECVSGDPETVNMKANGNFVDGYNAFKDYIVKAGWAIRARKIADKDAEFPINAWSASASKPNPMGITVVLQGAPTFAPGDKIAIKGTRRSGTDKTSYNGIYRVKSVVDSTIEPARIIYLSGSEGGEPTSIKVPGKYQTVNYGPFPIQKWSWFRAGTHKRGVSFGASHGRRLKRTSLV